MACIGYRTTAQSDPTPAILTHHGHLLTNHTNGKTPRAQSGEMVFINVYTWLNDSLVNSTIRDMGGPHEILLSDTVLLDEYAPPVYDAFFLMTKGDSATLIQAVDSFMARGIPKSFGEVKVVRYEIVMVEQLDTNAVRKKMEEEYQRGEVVRQEGKRVEKMLRTTLRKYKAGKLRHQIRKSPSGLEYLIYEKGSGAPVRKGEKLQIHYLGLLKKNGRLADNSYQFGESRPVSVDAIVPGINEGLLLLNHGGKAVLFIPAELAFGKTGVYGSPIGPNADLAFYIEIE